MVFARRGLPEEGVTDNGSQFASAEFKHFSSEHFKHITSSPHHPSGNGEAEHALQIAKRILQQNH